MFLTKTQNIYKVSLKKTIVFLRETGKETVQLT